MNSALYFTVKYLIQFLVFICSPFLYLISDFTFFFLYYVFQYRRSVVKQNLSNAFPQKTEEELTHIAKRFYKHFCDVILESLKILVISKSESAQRCKMSDSTKALFEKYYHEGKSTVIMMGHYGNWECAGSAFDLNCRQQLYVIYQPLSNKFFNRLVVDMRKKFGTRLIARRDTYKEIMRFKNEVTITAFIADQAPPPDGAYWTNFLNQDTPFFKGAEKIAKKMNYPVIYLCIKPVKRGYYEVHAETLFENSGDTSEGEITEAYAQRLEKDIKEQPEFWLWSHKRWKHKRR